MAYTTTFYVICVGGLAGVSYLCSLILKRRADAIRQHPMFKEDPVRQHNHAETLNRELTLKRTAIGLVAVCVFALLVRLWI